MPVCSRWFTFLTGGHNDTKYQQSVCVRLGGDTGLAAAQELDLNRRRLLLSGQSPRICDKSVCAKNFLLSAKEHGLQLPNDAKVILPWKTVKAAHAAYVREEEIRLNVEWELEDPAQEDEPLSEKSLCRYGNRLLGKKSEFGGRPEHKSIASLGWFCQVWTKDNTLSNLSIRKWMPFAKCDVCKQFKDQEETEKDPAVREEVRAKYKTHLEEVQIERRCYYSNRQRAQQDPARFLSLIIDGADQSDHRLPHWHEKSHATDGANKIKLHVYGCISHGRKAYAYTIPAHVGQGHNVTIEVIWRVMNETYTR